MYKSSLQGCKLSTLYSMIKNDDEGKIQGFQSSQIHGCLKYTIIIINGVMIIVNTLKALFCNRKQV